MRKNNPKKITTHLSFLCIQINVCLFGRGNYIATKRSVAGSPEKKKGNNNMDMKPAVVPASSTTILAS